MKGIKLLDQIYLKVTQRCLASDKYLSDEYHSEKYQILSNPDLIKITL